MPHFSKLNQSFRAASFQWCGDNRDEFSAKRNAAAKAMFDKHEAEQKAKRAKWRMTAPVSAAPRVVERLGSRTFGACTDRRRRDRRARCRGRVAARRDQGDGLRKDAARIAEVGAGLSLWSNAVLALRRLGVEGQAVAASSVVERSRSFFSDGTPAEAFEFADLTAKACRSAVDLRPPCRPSTHPPRSRDRRGPRCGPDRAGMHRVRRGCDGSCRPFRRWRPGGRRGADRRGRAPLGRSHAIVRR